MLGLGLGTKEQQILHQPVRQRLVALGKGRVLEQDPRSHALDIDICRKQTLGHGLEKSRTDSPESAYGRMRLGRNKTQTGIPHGSRRGRVRRLDNTQHGAVKACARLRAVGQRRCINLKCGLMQAPLGRPKIGRMNPLCTRKCLNIPVLREQCDGGNCLASQDAFQVLNQRKARALNDRSSFIAALFRPLHILLHCGFHGTQQQRWRAHAHHLQRTTCLVQLLPRDAQRSGIQ